MGKKSLLSSTSSKKGGGESDEGKEEKSKAASDRSKKTARTATKKKTSEEGVTPEKNAPKKKTAPKKKVVPTGASAAKSSVDAKARVSSAKKKPKAKTSAAKKRPVSGKDLLLKKSEMSFHEKKYTPSEDTDRKAEMLSPPFFAGKTPGESEQIRQLLFKKFDMASSEATSNQAPEALSKNVSSPLVATLSRKDNRKEGPVYSSVGSEGSEPPKKMDSMQKTALAGILGLLVLLVLVVSASISNSAKYYLQPVKGELQVWKGRFSPTGKKEFVTLGATPMPNQPKEVYTKNDIFPFIFESYVNQADALLNISDIPDFELIRRTLNKASGFAVSPELNETIHRRMSKINLMALVYKADILADKNTAADLSSARDALEKALRLNLDEAEKGLVNQKLQWIRDRQMQMEQVDNAAGVATADND